MERTSKKVRITIGSVPSTFELQKVDEGVRAVCALVRVCSDYGRARASSSASPRQVQRETTAPFLPFPSSSFFPLPRSSYPLQTPRVPTTALSALISSTRRRPTPLASTRPPLALPLPRMPQTPAQLYAAGLTAYRATSFEIAIDLFTEVRASLPPSPSQSPHSKPPLMRFGSRLSSWERARQSCLTQGRVHMSDWDGLRKDCTMRGRLSSLCLGRTRCVSASPPRAELADLSSRQGYLRAAKTLGSAREWAKAEKVLKQGLERVAATEEKGRAVRSLHCSLS